MATDKKKTRFLTFTAFCSGMTIMAIEMTASRLMAPYFGTSVFVWTNLLGIIMAALSIGYWFGGKLADRYPNQEYLYKLLLLVSFMLLALSVVAPAIMSMINLAVNNVNYAIVVNSFLGSLIVFGLPFTVLGMVSPTIIRLLSDEVEKSGEIAGRVYAASTVGSIIGTFLPTLVFVPLIGTKRTIILFAFILLLISLIGLARKRLLGLVLIFVATAVFLPTGYATDSQVLFEAETAYT
ncbi:MAG TPA: hypothetical protein ENN77_00495, partial [Candidatus Wirthbacteria bacterium]|nr:hypothetical protein [Candidatus Wirthbacteria bacterium]